MVKNSYSEGEAGPAGLGDGPTLRSKLPTQRKKFDSDTDLSLCSTRVQMGMSSLKIVDAEEGVESDNPDMRRTSHGTP
jgi:hypothetical protein